MKYQEWVWECLIGSLLTFLSGSSFGIRLILFANTDNGDEQRRCDSEDCHVAQCGVALLADCDQTNLGKCQAEQQEGQCNNEQLDSLRTFSVFQTLTNRLEVLKIKVGPVEITDSITTSQ